MRNKPRSTLPRPVVTMLPSIGRPDTKRAARLMAPVILSLWHLQAASTEPAAVPPAPTFGKGVRHD